LLPDLTAIVSTAKNETCCCCTPSEPLPDENCCGTPETPCSCSCGGVQKDKAVVPTTVLPVSKPKIVPAWDGISVCAIDNANVSGAFSLLGNHRALPPPHVPLHVSLCVFLN
jgi:hypothetical protein